MNPVAKGVLIGVVGLIVVTAIVLVVIPVFSELAYYADANKKIGAMDNPIRDRYGNICESNYYNSARQTCQSTPLWAKP